MALSKIKASTLPAGSVLQVQTGILTTGGALTASWADTGLSVTITPSSTSSKIWILMHTQTYNDANAGLGYKLFRGTTEIFDPNPDNGSGPLGQYTGGNNHYGPATLQYLDSPATTSATTYKIQARRYAANAAHFLRDSTTDGKAYITAWEIAG